MNNVNEETTLYLQRASPLRKVLWAPVTKRLLRRHGIMAATSKRSAKETRPQNAPPQSSSEKAKQTFLGRPFYNQGVITKKALPLFVTCLTFSAGGSWSRSMEECNIGIVLLGLACGSSGPAFCSHSSHPDAHGKQHSTPLFVSS